MVKLTKGERGRDRTGGEVERMGTHTAGQGSGWERTWADGWVKEGHAHFKRSSKW